MRGDRQVQTALSQDIDPMPQQDSVLARSSAGDVPASLIRVVCRETPAGSMSVSSGSATRFAEGRIMPMRALQPNLSSCGFMIYPASPAVFPEKARGGACFADRAPLSRRIPYCHHRRMPDDP